MSFEAEMRERVKRGESLDSIMEELSLIANKLEAEKKNNPRKDYIKQLENGYMEKAILPNASRNLEIVSIILTLSVADKVPGATREDLEQMYDTINEGMGTLMEELTEFLNLIDSL